MPPPPKRPHTSRKPEGLHSPNGDDADGPPLPPAVIERLGELLRDFYADLTEQPIPEHLKRLLDRLDHQRKADHDH